MAVRESKPLLTPEEFRVIAFQEAIGINSLYQLIRTNRIKHIRIGRKILIPKSEIDDFPQREAGILDA